MNRPVRPGRGLTGLLTRSLFTAAGIVAVPEPSTGAPFEEHNATDAEVDASDDFDPAHEISDDDGHGVAGELAAQLARVNPLDATFAVATAALSPDSRIRWTIAKALASSFRLVGDDFVLDQLLRDSDEGVRAAALEACVARGLARQSHS